MDPELAPLVPDPTTTEGREALVKLINPDPTAVLASLGLSFEDHTIPVKEGEIILSVIRPANWTVNSRLACIYYIH